MMTLKGNLGIGHTRYSTMGGADNVGLVQPFMVHTSYGTIAVAHNGELVNSNRLRERILANGVGLSTGSDSELITQALSMEPPEQFKQDYINKRFNRLTSKGEPVSNGQNGHDLEDSLNHSSPYATHLSQKEANFVARILHVSPPAAPTLGDTNSNLCLVDVPHASILLLGHSLRRMYICRKGSLR